MNFASDNSGPVHPRVMEALAKTNEGYALPYGAESGLDALRGRIRTLFEAPDAAVYLVGTGTAANALILSSLAKPWQAVFCGDRAHIHVDECGAPEFFSGGSKLVIVPTTNGKLHAEDLAQRIAGLPQGDVHSQQRGPVSITQVTECGTVYTLQELQALGQVAQDAGCPVHLDGARFANALARLGCSPAEMTWKAGVDAVSFGGTKNGLMGVEAVIFFDPALAWEFELRRKRAAHLFSKHRFLSAQMLAYLEDGLWLELARAANAACATLTTALELCPGVALRYPAEANMIFATFPRAAHRRLHEAGAQYYLYGGDLEGPAEEPLLARMVCDWSVSEGQIAQFVDILRG